MIELEDVAKTYGQSIVLDRINLSIEAARITGLLGPNGAGKTTLVSILTGIIKKDQGSIIINNKSIDRCQKDIQHMSSLVPQFLAFYPRLTTFENLEYFGALYGLKGKKLKSRIDAGIAIGSLEAFLHKRAEHFSGGMKRRLNLAIGILNEPQILYLDEPTVGVDPQSRNYILEMIMKINREQKTTVIYTSHYIEEIEQISDSVIIIDQGRILLHDNKETILHNTMEMSIIFAEPSEALKEISREMPGSAVLDNKLYIPRDKAYLANLEKMISLCRQKEMPVKDIQFGTKNLEELFLKLTNKKLRDL